MANDKILPQEPQDERAEAGVSCAEAGIPCAEADALCAEAGVPEEEREGRWSRFRDFLENATESTLFASRWLLAPVFLGLVVALLAITVNFIIKLVELIPDFMFASVDDIAVGVLNLLDIALLGNLVLIVVFSGYENFVSKIGAAQDHEDRPPWMGTLDFSGLKIKIVGSVVAISLIELLQDFIHVAEGHFSADIEIWRVALHLTFAVSGVLFAVMDLIAEKRHMYEHPQGDHAEAHGAKETGTAGEPE